MTFVASIAEQDLIDALGSLGLPAASGEQSPDGPDLVLEIDGVRHHFEVKNYALVDVPRALHLIRELSSRWGSPVATVVVADRIVDNARKELKRAGVSWFDRRGHLFLRNQGVLIDAATETLRKNPRPQGQSGGVKLAIAVDLLLHAPPALAVRETARRIGAAPSSVSESARKLREDGVLAIDGTFTTSEMFWSAAALWKPTWTPVARYPHPDSAMRNPALRLGFDHPEAPGWALSGDLAAAHLGAPIGLRAGVAPDLYVPTPQVHRLATSILGRVGEDLPAARIAVPPVPAACEHRLDVTSRVDEIWLVAQPLFVALDLAQDPGRGREILDSWDPAPWGSRVW